MGNPHVRSRAISDAHIIEAVGYADTAKGAVKKVKQWLNDRGGDAQQPAASEPAPAA